MDRPFYLNQLIRKMDNGMIKVITGMRRSGKTYLLTKLFNDYLMHNGVSRNNIIKIDFDDMRNDKLRDPRKLLKFIEKATKGKGKFYLLLDEVQFINDFQDVLNSFLHFKNVDTYVTGSNAKFLSRDIVTEFRGRGDQIHVYPFTFKEYVDSLCIESSKALNKYITYGGLPFVLTLDNENDAKQYLHNLAKETFLRDVIQRNNLVHQNEVEEVLNITASCIGSLINPKKISDTFKSVKQANVHNQTIANYLDYFEDAFIINKAQRYDVKGRKYINTPFKYYFTDIGVRNACLNFRQMEPTHIIENIIYNELIVRGYSVDVGNLKCSVTGTNNKRTTTNLEIDFVCNLMSSRLYIQSVYSMPTTQKRQQEERSLLKVADAFKKIIITNDPVEKHYDENGVFIINLIDFLLDEHSLDF